MKTRNIRFATLMVAVALSLNVSAQKNVLKAFEKFKTSKGVTITNTTHEQGQEGESAAQSWRCNVTEFKVWKGSGMTAKMKALQEAFEKDSRDQNVTYYGQMKGLDENATEEEKAKYKKTSVRYNNTDAPVVIGSNTAYNVLVLRCKSKQVNYRVVVAVEWKMDVQYGYVGTLYEIEGRNNLVRANTVSAAGVEDVGSVTYPNDNLIDRMTFYRDSYDYQKPDTPENTALLVNMLDYLSSHAADATENEKAVAYAVVKDMKYNSMVEMHKGILEHCVRVLDNADKVAVAQDALKRLDDYHNEFKRTTYVPERTKIIKRMESYLRGLQVLEMNQATFDAVREKLLNWKQDCTYIPNSELIGRVLQSLENKYNGKF